MANRKGCITVPLGEQLLTRVNTLARARHKNTKSSEAITVQSDSAEPSSHHFFSASTWYGVPISSFAKAFAASHV